jgi:hypothetical protein
MTLWQEGRRRVAACHRSVVQSPRSWLTRVTNKPLMTANKREFFQRLQKALLLAIIELDDRMHDVWSDRQRDAITEAGRLSHAAFCVEAQARVPEIAPGFADQISLKSLSFEGVHD